MKRFYSAWLVGVMFLVACSSKLTNENLQNVKNGMTETDVQKILGKPDSVETGETVGIRGTTYYYKSGDTQVKVIFLNNAVMAKEGSFK